MAGHATKTEWAVEEIRERIRSCAFLPGQRLLVEELSRELSMSPTPIREALRVLQAERLVEHRPHHGVVVTALTADQISEIYQLRSVLEPLATTLAAQQLNAAGLAQLEQMHTAMGDAVRRADPEALADCNRLWHWAIYETAVAPRLHDFIRQLWGAFPWRIVVLPSRSELRLGEHEAIMDALRRGSAEEAATLMRTHILSGEPDEIDAFQEMVEAAVGA